MAKENSRIGQKHKSSKILDLMNNSYLGKIVEIDDPERIGRVRIKVFGIFGDENNKLFNIPTEDLPWSYPINQGLVFGTNGSGKFSSPKMDAIVRVIFDGDQYHPRYWSLEDLDPDMKAELEADYEGFHSLLYDSSENLKILYSRNSGLLLSLNNSVINILPDNSIVIDHSGSSSTIELAGDVVTIKSNNAVDISTNNAITHNSNFVHVNGARTDVGGNPIYSSVNGEIMFALFQAIGTAIDSKMPLTPGVYAGLVAQIKTQMLSTTVKVSP